MMDIGATTPTNQVAWRQVAEQKYQRLMENLQVEEQRQRVEQLNITLYIAKNNKIQMEQARQESSINYLV
jgi:2C-methyl-D-erythritol 2,4-cyclodiphosphate synthase